MVRSACRALLAIPCCRAASILALDAWLKAIDISPPHLEASNPHQAVMMAVTERRMRAIVSRGPEWGTIGETPASSVEPSGVVEASSWSANERARSSAIITSAHGHGCGNHHPPGANEQLDSLPLARTDRFDPCRLVGRREPGE